MCAAEQKAKSQMCGDRSTIPLMWEKRQNYEYFICKYMHRKTQRPTMRVKTLGRESK